MSVPFISSCFTNRTRPYNTTQHLIESSWVLVCVFQEVETLGLEPDFCEEKQAFDAYFTHGYLIPPPPVPFLLLCSLFAPD